MKFLYDINNSCLITYDESLINENMIEIDIEVSDEYKQSIQNSTNLDLLKNKEHIIRSSLSEFVDNNIISEEDLNCIIHTGISSYEKAVDKNIQNNIIQEVNNDNEILDEIKNYLSENTNLEPEDIVLSRNDNGGYDLAVGDEIIGIHENPNFDYLDDIIDRVEEEQKLS